MKKLRRGGPRRPHYISGQGTTVVSERAQRYRNTPARYLQPHHYLLVVCIALVLGFGAVGYGLWQQRQLANERGISPELLMSSGDVGRALAGITAMSVLLAWVMLFVNQIRPWLARRLGARLGVTILDGFRQGWRVEEPAPLRATLIVHLVDCVVLALATILPLLPVLGLILALT